MPDSNPYTVGEATYRALPRLETKPTARYRDGRRDTGGEYERIRSYEYRPETHRKGKEDVYVYHHRLLAVVACYPDDMPVGEILRHLDGKDVHHESGVKWDNRPDNLAVRDHGRHSEITQAQMRAWAADAKADAKRNGHGEADARACANCGAEADTLCRSDDWQGKYCLSCTEESSSGAPVEVVQ